MSNSPPSLSLSFLSVPNLIPRALYTEQHSNPHAPNVSCKVATRNVSLTPPFFVDTPKKEKLIKLFSISPSHHPSHPPCCPSHPLTCIVYRQTRCTGYQIHPTFSIYSHPVSLVCLWGIRTAALTISRSQSIGQYLDCGCYAMSRWYSNWERRRRRRE